MFYLICAYTSKKISTAKEKNSTDASAPSARFSISEKEGWFLSSSAAKPASEIEKVHNYSILVISILQEIEKRAAWLLFNLGFCNIYYRV